ncbi:WD-repeat protein [Reticulomyxa filosa]|uniref:WD-repeat protein n=1 Tax=Reticulomyxa filosa TaxID=46433 RepID=X6LY70_RETFI|nr:WD-repeat protein [Reticulomyxa filosa]|eukprot:ETO06564.1 WD-repeat protein [Reticulomyxa filosa]
MTALINHEQTLHQLVAVSFITNLKKIGVFKFLLYLLYPKKNEIQIIIQYWIRILHIKIGRINDFDKLVINYVTFYFIFVFHLITTKIYKYICIFLLSQVTTLFMFDTLCLSFKLINTFTGPITVVRSIDYSTFDDCQFICSGSYDSIVRVWDVDNNKRMQSFNGHLSDVRCVKFSSYHNHRQNIICSSSNDKTIRFWDFKHNQQLQILNGHTFGVNGLKFSPFNGGRYLCSGSDDTTIRLWDVETSKSLHVFNGHIYHVCTIRIWDIEIAKQFNVFKGHTNSLWSVKYGSNELVNTILSGSSDRSVRLWDIRSSEQIQVFNGHSSVVMCVGYSSFVIKNSIGNSNVIYSGSLDNKIRFWDIRSNKEELYVIDGNDKDDGISCLKFVSLKKKMIVVFIYIMAQEMVEFVFGDKFFELKRLYQKGQFIYEFMNKLLDVSNRLKKAIICKYLFLYIEITGNRINYFFMFRANYDL